MARPRSPQGAVTCGEEFGFYFNCGGKPLAKDPVRFTSEKHLSGAAWGMRVRWGQDQSQESRGPGQGWGGLDEGESFLLPLALRSMAS